VVVLASQHVPRLTALGLDADSGQLA